MKYFETLKEKLLEKGLTEEVSAELVEMSKKEVPKDFVPSEKLKEAKTEYEALKETMVEKDKLITNLKNKAENLEDYEDQITDLKSKLEEVENGYQEKLAAKTLDARLNEEIAAMEDLNPKARGAFKKLLNVDEIKLTDNDLVGFKEQAEKIKEENDYMTLKKQTIGDDPKTGDNADGDESLDRVRAAMGLK